MSVAGRLFTGAYTAIFAAAALGLANVAGLGIVETFRAATGNGSIDPIDSVLTIGFVGATMLATAGAVWMGEKTIHPDPAAPRVKAQIDTGESATRIRHDRFIAY